MTDEILYMPFDGDYDASRSETLGRFATAILGDSLTTERETLLSFIGEDDPPVYKYPWNKTPIQAPCVEVCSADDDDGEGWGYIEYEKIPVDWRPDDVAELFQYGSIYFSPSHPPNNGMHATAQPGLITQD